MARKNISQITRDAIQAPQTDKVFLLLLTISSGEMEGPLYFVQNNESIVSNEIEYVPISFECTMPVEQDGGVQDTTITISGISRQVTEAIRSISTSPDVSLFIIRADDPDTMEIGPLNFKLRDTSYTADTVSGSLLYENSLNNNISTIKVTNQTFPGAYA